MGISRSVSAIGMILALAVTTAVGGCAATRRASGSGAFEGAQTTTDYVNAAQAWSKRYEANPKDKEAVLGYSRALRANGQTGQAVAVLEQATLHFGADFDIASAYGKALAANGNLEQALTVVRQANSRTSPDWRLLSAEGAILDQTGRHGEARATYNTGLQISPEEPAILNNLALSHLITNDKVLAEQYLRRAAASPRADRQVFQNLALVLGMTGRMGEAESILRQRFAPDVAEANIAYLRQTAMSQSATAAPATTGSIAAAKAVTAKAPPKPAS